MMTRPAQHLIQSIAAMGERPPYAWFLGAGCSVSSGVRAAASLVKEWRGRLFFIESVHRFSDDRPRAAYLKLCMACAHEGDSLLIPNQSLTLWLSPDSGEQDKPERLREPEGGAHLLKGRKLLTNTRGKIYFQWSEAAPDPDDIGFSRPEVDSLLASFRTWLHTQDWYEQPFEYSELFERLFALPSQRQAYIEREVEDARPYWGYLYLADMMSRGRFNVCFTTNFDDLLNDAFLRFTSEQRPMVCGHDSLVSQLRLSSKRPKIIKLHGDFLYDSIKNTRSELQNLDSNMAAKFAQFATELGLIVVGYSGHDSSIMSILGSLAQNPDAFPHGIHWCVRRGTPPGSHVERLAQHSRVLLYEIEDFDGFMAELYEGLGFGIPAFAANPTGSIAGYVGNCYNVLRDPPHPIVLKHSRQMYANFTGRAPEGEY